MKGILLLSLCAIAHADIDGFYENGCPRDTSIDKLLPHENCNQFYQCFHGKVIAKYCPSGLNFDLDLEKCDWKGDTKCVNKLLRYNYPNTKKKLEQSEVLDKTNPNHAYSICLSNERNGVLVAHENCDEYYKCSYSRPIAFTCAYNHLYNPETERCDWAHQVNCGDRVVPIKGFKRVTKDHATNSDPSLAPIICSAAAGSYGVLVAHENCNMYYKCYAGYPFAMKCPIHLLYNPDKESCDWPRNVYCDDDIYKKMIEIDRDERDKESEFDNSDPSQSDAICAENNSEGILVAHEKCNHFYNCSSGEPVPLLCPGNFLYNPNKSKEYCDWPHNVDCGDRTMPSSGEDENDTDDNYIESSVPQGETGAHHWDPSAVYAICRALGSDGVLVAHENCNQFYICHGGRPAALKCPGNLLYNPSKEFCDWPDQVDCGDRIVSEVDDSGHDDDNGSGDDPNADGYNHSDPREVPAICAAENSDGIVTAHENCNQYYQCFKGKPVTLFCQPDLLYNPSKNYCDLPLNVNCANRVISSNKTDNYSSHSSDNICSGSPDGYLISHKNCSMFYKCLSGQRLPMDCPQGLHYNAILKVCDWPINVQCGDRLTNQGLNKHAVVRRALANSIPLENII